MRRGAPAPPRDFIETATEIADLDELKRRFAEVAGLYGFHRSACVQIATPGRPVAPKMLFTHGATGKRLRVSAKTPPTFPG